MEQRPAARARVVAGAISAGAFGILAGSMAAEARGLAPDMAWPNVAGAYLRVAQRLIAERPAAT